MKIAFVIGTRPEIIKMSPVIRECEKRKTDYFLIHSNQHYSANMDEIFFKELELKTPKYNLNIKASLHGDMTAQILTGIEKILLSEKPDWVLVQGDTNTVLAGALAVAKLQIKLGHVEAGLRSYDRSMPEEINRVLTDHVSDALFCPTKKQAKILFKEGIESNKVFITGNTIVDAVQQNLNLATKHKKLQHYANEKYFLLTLHRPSNVDDKDNLQEIISSMCLIAKKYGFPVYFPIHPRTKKQLEKFSIEIDQNLIKPMEATGFLEMLILEKYAQLILTDSGGIQEEACILQVPSVTLRDNTERPETLDVGASMLAGNNKQKILDATKKMLNVKKNWSNPFGNGKAGEKIIKIIYEKK